MLSSETTSSLQRLCWQQQAASSDVQQMTTHAHTHARITDERFARRRRRLVIIGFKFRFQLVVSVKCSNFILYKLFIPTSQGFGCSCRFGILQLVLFYLFSTAIFKRTVLYAACVNNNIAPFASIAIICAIAAAAIIK